MFIFQLFKTKSKQYIAALSRNKLSLVNVISDKKANTLSPIKHCFDLAADICLSLND